MILKYMEKTMSSGPTMVALSISDYAGMLNKIEEYREALMYIQEDAPPHGYVYKLIEKVLDLDE